ncbi:hypothetical protein CISECK367B_01240 [Citrobacter sedlakii]
MTHGDKHNACQNEETRSGAVLEQEGGGNDSPFDINDEATSKKSPHRGGQEILEAM